MGTVGFGLSGAGRARGDAPWAAAVLFLLGLAVAGCGAAALARVPWDEAALHVAARDWPVAEAAVLDLALQDEPDAGRAGAGRRLVLLARYAYEVGGVRYEGGRIGFAGKGDRADRRLEALYARLNFARVTGRSIAVRYDPADPANARLDGDFPWRRAALDAGIGLLLLLAGGMALRNAARSQRPAR